jgi:hypothetical protein
MLTDAIKTVDPEKAATLRNADQAWRAFLPLDRASATMGAMGNEGVAAPRQLLSAMKALDKSQNDNALRGVMSSGAGNNPYERLVQNMQQASNVFGQSVPDSGTAGRTMMGIGAAMAGGVPAMTAAAGAWAGAGAAYSKLGSRLLTQGVAPKQVEKLIAAAASKGIPEDVLLAMGPLAMAATMRQLGARQ